MPTDPSELESLSRVFRYQTTPPAKGSDLWTLWLRLPLAPGNPGETATYSEVPALNRLIRFCQGMLQGAAGLPLTPPPEVALKDNRDLRLTVRQEVHPEGDPPYYTLTVTAPVRPRVCGHLTEREAARALMIWVESFLPDLFRVTEPTPPALPTGSVPSPTIGEA